VTETDCRRSARCHTLAAFAHVSRPFKKIGVAPRGPRSSARRRRGGVSPVAIDRTVNDDDDDDVPRDVPRSFRGRKPRVSWIRARSGKTMAHAKCHRIDTPHSLAHESPAEELDSESFCASEEMSAAASIDSAANTYGERCEVFQREVQPATRSNRVRLASPA